MSSSLFEEYPLQVRQKQDWGQGFNFLLTHAPVLPGSDAGSNVVKPALNSSFKTVRPRAPCVARCMKHAIRTWYGVCSEAPNSQFSEGARPHLCIDKWNRPTPVCMRLSLTQAARDKLIQTGLALVLGIKTRSLDVFTQNSEFYL